MKKKTTQQTTAPLFNVIFEVVRSIPEGAVATYVPWHRVVNHQGRISPRGNGDGEQMQRVLLEAEGICFDETGRIDLPRARWEFPV